METQKHVYLIELPLDGVTDGWFTVARATTPEGAAAVVAALLANMKVLTSQLRIDVRTEI